MTQLQAKDGMVFESTKTYTHSQGLSCAFRQWRAKHSHCRFLHGYAIQVTIVFRSSSLNECNWVMDFGGLKQVKKWLEEVFDHKTLVARDDPQFGYFLEMHARGVIEMRAVDHVGCEAFAKMIFEGVQILQNESGVAPPADLVVQEVEVREHGGNSARYKRS